MFLVLLQYQNIDAVDRLLTEHYENPAGVFALGLVRIAGRLEPRTGGLMIVDGDRRAVEDAVASDPFVKSGAATATITEFHATWHSVGGGGAASE
jgi:uncharacterized protein YciI